MSAPRDEDRLLDHRYDDIQEFDNPLPGWWTLILWATIVWAIAYWLNVVPGVGSGKGREANYEAEMAAAAEAYGSPEQQAAAALDVAAMTAALADAGALESGRATFESTCAPCHERDGGGNIGPNLTDDAWIHGNSHRRILSTIVNGVPDKGMPGWGAILGPEQVSRVSAYTLTLHGTRPAKSKAPQGEPLGAPVREDDTPGHPPK